MCLLLDRRISTIGVRMRNTWHLGQLTSCARGSVAIRKSRLEFGSGYFRFSFTLIVQ